MKTPYLKDIPLDTAIMKLSVFLKENQLYEPLQEENIILDENAIHRVLFKPVFSPDSSPNYHASAMDGFAVRADTTREAQNAKPRTLHMTEFKYVDTGDPIPEWADAVIPVENVESYDTDTKIAEDLRKPDMIKIRIPALPWQHVRLMGEDIVSTQLLFPRGHVLRPIDLGALAACGIQRVSVSRKPRVMVIPTGTELVPVGQIAQKGEIIEFNSIVLAAMVNQWGGEAIRSPIIKDDLNEIKSKIVEAAAVSDLILLNAGSSAGSEDFSADAIDALGGVILHGVAVRPGHPVIIGFVRTRSVNRKIRKIPIIGVPGYPVSAALTAELFVEPLIARWTGREPVVHEEISARLTKKVSSPAGDTDLLRVVAGKVGNQFLCAPLPRGAGTVTSLTKADGLVLIPPGVQGLSAGEFVRVKLYCGTKKLSATIFATGSHDLTLDLLAQSLVDHNLRLVSSNVGSQGGLIALNKRETHIAGTHLLDTSSGKYNQIFLQKFVPDYPALLFHWVQREQGIIVRKGNPKLIRSLEDLCNAGLRFVNRQRGSGTRLLLDYHLRILDIDTNHIKGYSSEEYTHLAVAVAVASGRADCGLGIASAARALGLDFLPLFYEQYDLALLDIPDSDDIINLLLEISNNKRFKDEVINLGGYDTSKMGQIWRQKVKAGSLLKQS